MTVNIKNDNISSRFLHAVKSVQENYHYTQKDLADTLMVDSSAISHIASGRTKTPSRQLISKFSAHFLIDEDWILTGEGMDPEKSLQFSDDLMNTKEMSSPKLFMTLKNIMSYLDSAAHRMEMNRIEVLYIENWIGNVLNELKQSPLFEKSPFIEDEELTQAWNTLDSRRRHNVRILIKASAKETAKEKRENWKYKPPTTEEAIAELKARSSPSPLVEAWACIPQEDLEKVKGLVLDVLRAANPVTRPEGAGSTPREPVSDDQLTDILEAKGIPIPDRVPSSSKTQVTRSSDPPTPHQGKSRRAKRRRVAPQTNTNRMER